MLENLLPTDAELLIRTPRMILEPVLESHAWDLTALLADAELHRYVPFDPPSFEGQRDRCRKWAGRISPNRDELWLNWAAKLASTGKLIAHFQAGVRVDGEATLGYIVAREVQRQGFAREGLGAIMELLRSKVSVTRFRAEIDTRNVASIALMKALGFKQVDFVRSVSYFKGANSDEFVFTWPG